jgi:hypothetical protein
MPDASRKFGHRNRQRPDIRPDCKIIVMKRQRPRSLAFSFLRRRYEINLRVQRVSCHRQRSAEDVTARFSQLP